MEINIFDYVTDEQIREEILSSIRQKAMNMTEHDFTRIMTNSFYHSVRKLSEEVIEKNGYEFDIKESIRKIIQELSSYTVFDLDDSKNKNRILLEKIVSEEESLLREKVIATFDKAFSEYSASQDIAEILSNHVYEIFSIKKDQQDGRPC